MRERQLEAIGFSTHLVDFKRNLAGPDHAFDCKWFGTLRSPTTICSAGEHRTIRSEFEGQRSGSESLSKGEAGSLESPVNFFEKTPHDRTGALVADEHLLLEGSEFSAADIAGNTAGRLAHFGIREEDGRRDVFGNLVGFDHNAATTFRVLRSGFQHAFDFGQVEPFVAAGMTLKGTGLEVFEAAGAVPRPLIVGVEDVACRVEAHSARRSDAAAGGNQFTVGRNTHAPTAILAVTVERSGEAKRDPDVSIAVELRSESVLVVIAVDIPTGVHGFKQVGFAVARGVFNP